MHITEGQIRQLRALDAAGKGLHDPLQGWLRQISSGGVARAEERDPFLSSTKLWWDTIGSAIDARTIRQYRAKIAPVPEHLLEIDPKYPALNRLVLDDPRLRRTVRSRLIGVQHAEYGYTDNTLVPCDEERHVTPREPYWFRAHDGRPNRNRKPSACRAECTGDLLAGTADVLLAIFLHDRNVVRENEHYMDGPGSVHRGDRDDCAYLGVWDGDPGLCADGNDYANPDYGSVVFRR